MSFLTFSVAVLFIAFVVLGLIDRSAGSAWGWIVGTDALTMVAAWMALPLLRARKLPRALTYPAGIVIAAVPAANSLLAFALTGNAFFLVYLVMVAIGCGSFMLSLPWLWLSFGLLSLATWPVATMHLSPVLASQYAPAMVGAFLVSTLVLIIRRFHVIDSQRALMAMQREAEERKRAQAHLAHAQRLESIGKLVSGIAHDFNNLLMVVLGYTDSMLETATQAEILEDLRIVRGAGTSAAALAAKLLAFSRQQVMQPEVSDINALVRSARDLVTKALPADIELLVELDPDAGTALVDPLQIEQVLVNLTLNARDALADSAGRITLATRRIPETSRGEHIEIVVNDNGSGMSEEVRARAFEPFFTTKPAGHGTGLGLAMVHGIIVQSNGIIDITSRVGEGTTVAFSLPRVGAVSSSPADRALGGQERLAGLTVLVVDDEPLVLAVVSRILTKNGCVVLSANDAEQALTLAATSAFDLLVSDVVMPGMSGVALVSALRKRGNLQPALLMSGHAAEKVAQSGGLNAPLLHKPFSAEELTRALTALLPVLV